MDSTAPLFVSMIPTFLASLRSVGTACTMAAVGIYLHRRDYIVGEGKRTLALISQQVTIPCFLFTKVVYCNQDWSTKPCPNVMDNMADIWVLLFWPMYVVGCGLLVGYAASLVARTPRRHVRSVLAACAFGNSTGLPITLLTVIHANFPSTTELGAIDPTLFLSVYLLLFPVLQWGVGGWLLAPDEEVDQEEQERTDGIEVAEDKSEQKSLLVDDEEQDEEGDGGKLTRPSLSSGIGASIYQSFRVVSSPGARNVLNNRSMAAFYRNSRRGIGETDASLYISNADLVALNRSFRKTAAAEDATEKMGALEEGGGGGEGQGVNGVGTELPPVYTITSPDSGLPPPSPLPPPPATAQDTLFAPHSGMITYGSLFPVEQQPSLPPRTPPTSPPPTLASSSIATTMYATAPSLPSVVSSPPPPPPPSDDRHFRSFNEPIAVAPAAAAAAADAVLPASDDEAPILETLAHILGRCLQPPVVGALLGLFVAAIPFLRGLFVDLVNRADAAPFEWMFDGMYAVGQAAVPLNMMILGCNLSASFALSSAEGGEKGKGEEYDDAILAGRLLSDQTMAAIVVGKMIVMPAVGIASCALFSRYAWDIPDDIDAAFYLVAMIVFITPTANNVMVMVELSGAGTKEGIARVIGWQYVVAPVILSLSVTLVVGMASRWS